jgi:hypothetical protein
MKKVVWLIFCLFSMALAKAQGTNTEQSGNPKTGPKIIVGEKAHYFGDIKQGEKVSHTFKFANMGTEPLVLSDVKTTCGCTATHWTKDPIAPGKTGEISATFNSAGKTGKQQKVITILSNSVTGIETVSIITNVLP